MNYKVGDEVLVKARVIAGSGRYFGVEVEGDCFDVCEGNVVPVPDMTAEEAWEIAKKIADMLCEESNEIFGTAHLEHILQRNTPQEAKAKIEAWGVEKEIKVGDIVRPKTTKEREYMVTYISESKKLAGVCLQTGEVIPEAFEVSADSVVKTGRHIDIELLLNKIGGE